MSHRFTHFKSTLAMATSLACQLLDKLAAEVGESGTHKSPSHALGEMPSSIVRLTAPPLPAPPLPTGADPADPQGLQRKLGPEELQAMMERLSTGYMENRAKLRAAAEAVTYPEALPRVLPEEELQDDPAARPGDIPGSCVHYLTSPWFQACVERLAYQDVEDRVANLEDLDTRLYPEADPTPLDEDTQYESVNRLHGTGIGNPRLDDAGEGSGDDGFPRSPHVKKLSADKLNE
eukprot:gene2917-572_t